MDFQKTPPLDKQSNIQRLTPRIAPYWNTLEFCRHIGVQKHPTTGTYWVARVRVKTGGYYLQKRLSSLCFKGVNGIGYERAIELAKDWFASPEIAARATESYPVGVNQKLRYEKQVEAFTIGDALCDYVEWKRISAARTHFETNLSLINYHIIPRLGNIAVEDFTGRMFTEFCRDVLETPPKRGRQLTPPRVTLEQIGEESLRKRKKTLNTLIGILRSAFRMSWENGETASDRAWRCLKRLPHADTPRKEFLTRAQCKALLDASKPDLRRLILGALYTGCRVSELAQMRARDVGGHFFGVYVRPLKSYRARYVHLPDEGMSYFLDLCEGKDDEALVFEMDSGRRWTGGHKHLFKNAVIEAGLPRNFVFHGLRHTYASQLVQAGTPLAIVAKQLGHTTTDTVSRTYGHLSCQSVEEELSRRFAPLATPRSDPRLAKIRDSLQTVDVPSVSWPTRNHSQATGEIVAFLKSAAEK